MTAGSPADRSAVVDTGRAAGGDLAMASAAARDYPVREQLRKDLQPEKDRGTHPRRFSCRHR
jgi:hypothetical protein